MLGMKARAHTHTGQESSVSTFLDPDFNLIYRFELGGLICGYEELFPSPRTFIYKGKLGIKFVSKTTAIHFYYFLPISRPYNFL